MSSRAGGVLYLDSSALVKLAVREPETTALERRAKASGALRNELDHGDRGEPRDGTRTTAAARRAPAARCCRSLSATVEMVLTDRVCRTASTLAPAQLRTLDAIHVASALALGADLAAVVTYDIRMQQAAEHCRLRVLAPT